MVRIVLMFFLMTTLTNAQDFKPTLSRSEGKRWPMLGDFRKIFLNQRVVVN
jgi:hypothetical protein